MWKRFLQSPDAVKSLPRRNLERLYIASQADFEKYSDHEASLQKNVESLGLQICQIIAESTPKMQTKREAENERSMQFQDELNVVKFETLSIENEISEQELLLDRLSYLSEQEGIYQRNSIEQIANCFTQIAADTDDPCEMEDALTCLDLLHGGTNVLKGRVLLNKTYFQRRSNELQRELKGLIEQAANMSLASQEIKKEFDSISTDNMLFRETAPALKEQLQKDLEALGETREPLLKMRSKVKRLTHKRDLLMNPIAVMKSEITVSASVANLTDEALQKSMSLRNSIQESETKEQEIKEREKVLQSQLSGTKDLMCDIEKEIQILEDSIQEINAQTERVNSHLSLLQKAGITNESDYQIVSKASKSNPESIDDEIRMLEGINPKLEAIVINLKEQIGEMKTQLEGYDQHISMLETKRKEIANASQ